MGGSQPRFLVMAGPNGAGKSTCVKFFLPEPILYINADEIAKTLSNEQTHDAEIQAARIAIQWMDEAEAREESFATETTLASKTLASRAVIGCSEVGVSFSTWSTFGRQAPTSRSNGWPKGFDSGGHNIPEATIRRRWLAGLRNFFSLYQTDRRCLGCRRQLQLEHTQIHRVRAT